MKRIAITLGDPAGIGGEIILRGLTKLRAQTIPVVVGDHAVLSASAAACVPGQTVVFKDFMQGAPGDVELLDLGIVKDVVFGASDGACGEASYQYVLEALKLLFTGDVSALVTCPISKKSIHQAGITFPGHTELLAHYGGVTEYVMMMAVGSFRVSLVTIHIALKEVPTRITSADVFKCISITNGSLKDYFGVERPRIKVCGLNPHAGEQGLMGDEEQLISEAIDHACGLGMRVDGPFSADSLFHYIDSDAYVAMYHDQGLIPVKTRDFSRTVNITLGLPFIRTSVGHGTGFDIAGTGKANPASLIEAYRTAERMLLAST